MMNIKHVHDVGMDDMGMTITKIGGKLDGEKFSTVEAEMDDGSRIRLWASNARPGLFRQVFIPWDFKHSKIVD